MYSSRNFKICLQKVFFIKIQNGHRKQVLMIKEMQKKHEKVRIKILRCKLIRVLVNKV